MAKEQWAIYDPDGDLICLVSGPKKVAEQSLPAEAVGEIIQVTTKDEPDAALQDVPMKKPKTAAAVKSAVKAKMEEHAQRVRAAVEEARKQRNAKANRPQ